MLSAQRQDDDATKGHVWYGPKIETPIDELVAPWKSVGHYLLHKMSTDNAEAYLITDFASGRRWTGSQLRDKALAVASCLLEKYNFQPGTVVCLSYNNSDHLIILALGVIIAGGTIACSFYKDPYAELLYLARKVEPKMLFCHGKNLHWAAQLTRDLGYQIEGVSMDNNEPASQDKFTFAEIMAYVVKDQSVLQALPVACAQDLKQQTALITMSSGTTGKPKAVAQTHFNCIADLVKMRRINYKQISFACSASLDYVSGRLIVLGAIDAGYNAVILDGFEPESYLSAIEKYKVAIVYLGAASFYNLITYPQLDRFDLSSLRCVFPMGAKIIYLEELRNFFERHPNITQVRQGYGASELSGGAMNTMTPEQYLKDCDNCGNLMPGIQAKIVDPETGRALDSNQQGILHLKGATVFPGYYDIDQARKRLENNPDDVNHNHKQADLSRVSPFVWDEAIFDEEGYYITGDLAYFNDQEQLYIIGRQKELMACRGSKKVLPQELEEIIAGHPAVSKVCVLGIPNKHEFALQCPRAFIVPKEVCYDDTKDDKDLELGPKLEILNEDLEKDLKTEQLHHVGEHKLCRMATKRCRLLAEDIMYFVNARVGWEKQLTGGIVILDDIPTSRSTGKINKNYLRSLKTDQVEIYGDRSS